MKAPAFPANIRLGWKGLLVFGRGKTFHPSLMFVSKARSLPRVEQLKGISLR
jgi:hypothetical protein